MIQHVSDINIVILTFAIVAYLGTARFITYQRLDATFDNKQRDKKKNFLRNIRIPDTVYCVLAIFFLFDVFFLWAACNKDIFWDWIKWFGTEYSSIRVKLLLVAYTAFFVASVWLMIIHICYLWKPLSDDQGRGQELCISELNTYLQRFFDTVRALKKNLDSIDAEFNALKKNHDELKRRFDSLLKKTNVE